MELFILVFIVGAIGAVPLQSRGVRVRRDADPVDSNSTTEFNGCLLDKVEYKDGEDVPSLSPCERCVCEAPDVVCSMVKCQPNSGCKIIQQSGQCCPEYKCDCEYNEKLYNNGERLDKPEDPCQVCYCKGGEIMCTSITCYERDDCEPHFSPDQCCPKYDHCPVEAKNVSGHSVRSVNASVYSPKREMQPWPLTNPSNSQSSTGYDDSNGSNNVYPQTIKIVEILPTTPGYVNKPSEVSVIPRVKTNDEENKEYSKEADPRPSEEILQGSSTTEAFESSTLPASSTSEIDHLLDTTPEPEEENEKQISEVIPERSVSTLNPLAEEIALSSSTTADPEAEPDSQKMATIYPNYFSTDHDSNNTEESTTYEPTTEIEGSGYELLRGGIYEDYSSESPEYASVENTTDTIAHNETSHESNEETINETQDISSYEAYTATETYSSDEYSSPSRKIIEANSTNITSVEVFDSNDSGTEIKGNLKAVSESESDSSSSEEFSSEEKFSESTENFNKTESLENSTVYPTTYSEEYFQSSENNSNPYSFEASSSENVYEELTTTSELHTENHGISSVAENDVKFAANLLDSNETETTTPVEVYIQTTLSGELTETDNTTDKGLLQPRYIGSEFAIDKNKKMPRLAYRKLEKDANDFETSSTLTFPSVLNVHSLGTDQISSQTESSLPENTTTMAKVGIYHPSKANELAGYLTIVDDKTNSTSANDSVISSHLLLTPHDLKKLAEILIHEKIKPAHLQASNTKGDENISNYTNTENVTDEGRSDSSWTELSTEDKESSFFSNSEGLNEDIKSLGVTTLGTSSIDDIPSERRTVGKENVSGAQYVEESDTTIATPVTSTQKENLSEDPNTSRQIRIPENVNQYSSLLDDRDLKILENFFRKNIGLQ